jgi:zinc transporter ZupT
MNHSEKQGKNPIKISTWSKIFWQVEAMTIVGGLVGWFIIRNVPHAWLQITLALMLANACGGFLYLAIHAIWGEIFRHHKGLVLGNFAGGFGVIAGLILYFHLKA